MMKLLALLLATLVGVSVQQCTKESFDEYKIRLLEEEIVERTNRTIVMIHTNSTIYNCLATSVTLGEYRSMSVSIQYVFSTDVSTLRQIRYNLRCNSQTGNWSRPSGLSSIAFMGERSDCYDCTDQSVNDHHCTR